MLNKRKKLGIWIASLSVFTAVQLGSFYQLNNFLKPPEIKKAKQKPMEAPKVLAAPLSSQPDVTVPKDVVDYVLSPDHKVVAYIKSIPDSNNVQLVIEEAQGIIHQETVKKVSHMEWLGESHTLLYMLDTQTKQQMYLFQQQHKNPLQVHAWAGTSRVVQQVFFSPYLEFFYVYIKNEKKDELYKYTFSTGMQFLPTQQIEVFNVSYDPKLDILTITDKKGGNWQYRDGGLWDGQGKLYATIQQEQAKQEALLKQKLKEEVLKQEKLKQAALKQLEREAKQK